MLLWSVAAGVVWYLSFIVFLKAIDISGLSGSTQWKNLQGIFGVLFSLLLLGEYKSSDPFIVLLSGVIIFISALLFTINSDASRKKTIYKGVLLAILSAVGFGLVAVINKYVTVNVGIYSQQVVWSGAIFFSGVFFIGFQPKLRQSFLKMPYRDFVIGLIGGFLYTGASFFMLTSYKYIDAAIAFNVIQLNGIWTILIGLIVFKEIDFKKYWPRITLGLLLSIIAIVILRLA